jgi:hypothetical protein
MTMDAPFVPDPLPVFDQVYTACPIEDTEKKSILQSISDVAHSYLDSTTASRYASIDPARDPNAHTLAPIDDGDVAERRRQFYGNKVFRGDPHLFAGF